MNIVFFGTPEFAVPALKALLDNKHQVLAVVTQPDRPCGRGRHIAYSPVKAAADAAGLRIIQPDRVRDTGFIEELRKIGADVIVTAAYGQILPREILNMPEKGCINVHASLLPKYRGASPISQSVINGDTETGVTTMLMDEGMDTGDILLQEKVEVSYTDTAGSLSRRLSVVGAELLLLTLERLEEGGIVPKPQAGEVSFAPLLKKSDAIIQWERTAIDLYNFIRGMNPWPCAYTFLEGDMIKILRSERMDGEAEAGVVSMVTKKEIFVGTGKGLLSILEVQAPGKRPMDIKAFLQGRRIHEGVRFNDKPAA
ncbi:MAG: methionyl-tRNA formyltransferase [Thermodesulfovibrionia bacterium]|nr:methionyl-tRNA formyltransferase [Thermodesulfovibrionia bacterium]